MFSVVVPLYNKGHTVIETMRTVLAQDFGDFEVIVVNDGSTDDGPAKLERAFTDSRIRMIHQQNQGAAAARNLGVQVARHELIAFLDADDLWEPGYLSAMKEAAEQFPQAGIYCCAGTIRRPDGSGFLRYSAQYRRTQLVDYFRNPALFGTTSSTVVRKSRFDERRGFPVGVRHFEDQTLFWALALTAPAAYCPTPLTVKNEGVPGQTSAAPIDVHRYRALRSNAAYSVWSDLEPARRDRTFPRYMRYEVTNSIQPLIAAKDFAAVIDVLAMLDPRLRAGLSRMERFLYVRPRASPLSRVVLRAARRLRRPKGHQNLVFAPILPSADRSVGRRMLGQHEEQQSQAQQGIESDKDGPADQRPVHDSPLPAHPPDTALIGQQISRHQREADVDPLPLGGRRPGGDLPQARRRDVHPHGVEHPAESS